MELDRDHAGRFWLYLCQAFYTAGSPQEFQEFVNSISNTMMHFSVLGNCESTVGIDACSEFVESVNTLMENLLERSEDEIDNLGVIPLSAHLKKLHRIFDELLEGSDMEPAADSDPNSPGDPRSLVNALLYHSICDIVMLTHQPMETKIEMIWDGVRMVGAKPVLPPEEYLLEVANKTGIGGVYRQMFVCEDGGGKFWQLTNHLCVQKGHHSADFMQEYGSVLTQVEKSLLKKYGILEDVNIANDYLKCILSYVINDLNSHLPMGG